MALWISLRVAKPCLACWVSKTDNGSFSKLRQAEWPLCSASKVGIQPGPDSLYHGKGSPTLSGQNCSGSGHTDWASNSRGIAQ